MHIGLCLWVDKQCSTLCFEFFNKIISCGRKGEDQGLGPPLWSVVGEGGLRSGLEGSVYCGSRGSASRPDPRLGDGGASSFGLRLRTGDRCSLKGRSTGAWSWSSCTDTARRPAERGLGLSWPSSFLGPKQGSSGRPRLSGEGLAFRGLRQGEGGPGPSCGPQPRLLSSAFSCCPSVFQVVDSGPWPPGPGLHEGSADTEWVRDLIEMGGASEELSIMSPSEPAFLISPSLLCFLFPSALPLPLLTPILCSITCTLCSKDGVSSVSPRSRGRLLSGLAPNAASSSSAGSSIIE